MKKATLLELIEQNKVNEVSQLVFNNHYDGDDERGYTMPLSYEEETQVIIQATTTSDSLCSEWQKLLTDYSEKYPLSNQALEALIERRSIPFALGLLLLHLAKYGWSEQIAFKICQTTYQEGLSEPNVAMLKYICNYGRIFYTNIYNLLERIVDRHGNNNEEVSVPKFHQLYRDTVDKYRKENNLLNFQS